MLHKYLKIDLNKSLKDEYPTLPCPSDFFFLWCWHLFHHHFLQTFGCLLPCDCHLGCRCVPLLGGILSNMMDQGCWFPVESQISWWNYNKGSCYIHMASIIIFPTSMASKDWYEKKTSYIPGCWRIFESWICTYTPCEDRMPKMMSKQKHVNKTLFNLSTQNQFSSSFSTSSGSAGIIFSSPGISSWPVTLPDATTFVTESAVVATTVGTTGSGHFTGGPGETCPTSGGFSSPAKLSQESQASLVDSVVPTLSSFKSPFSISNKACQFTNLEGKSPRLETNSWHPN